MSSSVLVIKMRDEKTRKPSSPDPPFTADSSDVAIFTLSACLEARSIFYYRCSQMRGFSLERESRHPFSITERRLCHDRTTEGDDFRLLRHAHRLGERHPALFRPAIGRPPSPRPGPARAATALGRDAVGRHPAAVPSLSRSAARDDAHDPPELADSLRRAGP